MIARNDNLMAMGQFTEPSIKVFNCTQVLAEHREISRVDQDVAIRNFQLTMQFMRVADED
jgi:hypothetical protein